MDEPNPGAGTTAPPGTGSPAATPPAPAAQPPAAKSTALTGDSAAAPTSPAAAAPGAPEAAPKAPDASSKAPEAYAAFDLPAGIEPKDALLSEFTPLAKELGLSQENAQKLVTLYGKAIQQHADTWAATIEGWKQAAKNDPEIGGPDEQAKLVIAQKALRKFGDADTVKLLEDFGLGEFPGLRRTFYRVGLAIQEDGSVIGAPPAPAPKSPTSTLYGKVDVPQQVVAQT